MAASLLACAIILWSVVPAPPATPAQESRIKDSIAKLASDDPAVRDAATAELIRIGEPARALVEAASRGGDAEVRSRAALILKRLDGIALDGKLKPHWGALGTEGAFWIDRAGWELATKADRTDLPGPIADALAAADLDVIAAVLAEGRVISTELLDRKTAQPGWHGHAICSVGGRSVRGCEKQLPSEPLIRNATIAFVLKAPTEAEQHADLLHPRMVRALGAALDHGSPEIRAAAAHGFRHYFFPDSVDAVAKAIADKSEPVRTAAVSTLRALAGDAATDVDAFLKRWATSDRDAEQLKFVTTNPEALARMKAVMASCESPK